MQYHVGIIITKEPGKTLVKLLKKGTAILSLIQFGKYLCNVFMRLEIAFVFVYDTQSRGVIAISVSKVSGL